MNKFFLVLVIGSLYFSTASFCQVLYLQSGSNFFISSGTIVSLDSLVLTPSSNYNITGANRIQKRTTVAHSLSTPYISRVYRLNNTISGYSGKIIIYYQDAELNGITESALNLDVYNGFAWNVYTANVSRNATNNFVATARLTNIALNELTLVNSASSASFGNVQPTSSKSNLVSFSLLQNVPNPFNHKTTIGYILPQTYSSAKIVITDKSGKPIKEISISGNGKGSVDVDASTLTSGAYSYALYVNGKLIDTKQMILAK